MPIKAVIFDMDGLLVNSEPMWQDARIAAFGAERLRWTDADQEAVMGSSTLGWARYLQARLGDEISLENIIEQVLVQMERLYRENVPLMPGADALVRALSADYPLGLASGAPRRLITAVLDGAGWWPFFREVMSADDVPNGKPAPDVYLDVARKLGAAPAEVAVFEDSGNGIKSGLAAGMHVIAVPDAYHRPAAEILDQAALVLPDGLPGFDPATLRDW